MSEHDSNAGRSLAICGLFESELLLQLMLLQWKHPLAEDAEYRTNLLETATEVLDAAARGPGEAEFIQGLPPNEMNLVAAIWYAEQRALEEDDQERAGREQWLMDVRRSLPSCFCDPDELC